MNDYAIIILNWNGFKDTIELLNSVFDNDNKGDIYLLDNGSSDDSVNKILKFLESSSFKYDVCSLDSFKINKQNSLHFITSLVNYGFAVGNNSVIEKINGLYDFYILLNNDTILEKKALTSLVSYAKQNHIDAISPKITNFYNKKLWYGGGRFTIYGDRKYYSEKKIRKYKKEFLFCTFITGCCLCLSQGVLNEIGLLSEDFFFGEEDFQYSYMLKKKHKRVGVLLSINIFHKISASSSKYPSKNTYILHFVNRYVDKKILFSKFKYFSWKLIYSPLLFLRTIKTYKSFKQSITIVKKIFLFAKRNNVKKDTFIEIMNLDFDKKIIK